MTDRHSPFRDSVLDEKEVRLIVEETVKTTLANLGITIDDPREVQKDLIHLREWRLTLQKVRNQSMVSALGIIVTGVLGALFLGIRELLKRSG